jgi:hypothetical protein
MLMFYWRLDYLGESYSMNKFAIKLSIFFYYLCYFVLLLSIHTMVMLNAIIWVVVILYHFLCYHLNIYFTYILVAIYFGCFFIYLVIFVFLLLFYLFLLLWSYILLYFTIWNLLLSTFGLKTICLHMFLFNLYYHVVSI